MSAALLMLPQMSVAIRETRGDETGTAILLTGLPGAGKTTLAERLAEVVTASGRTASVLDGDEIRRVFSPDLGFSAEERHLNTQRMAFISREIIRHRGVAICATIAPFEESRNEFGRVLREVGDFVLIYVATRLEVCMARDPKGLYAKARQGRIAGLTGLSAPYEPPKNADLVIDTSSETVSESVSAIASFLQCRGLLGKLPQITV